MDSYKDHLGGDNQKVKDLYDQWSAAFDGIPDGHTIGPDELKDEASGDLSEVYTWSEALGHLYLEGK